MIKFYVAGALVVSLLLAGWKIDSLRSENAALVIQNDILEGNVLSLKEQADFELSQNMKHVERNRVMNDKLVKSEESLTYLRGVFNKHDFGNLLAKKPQLITNRMIKGTEKVLQELEDATN